MPSRTALLRRLPIGDATPKVRSAWLLGLLVAYFLGFSNATGDGLRFSSIRLNYFFFCGVLFLPVLMLGVALGYRGWATKLAVGFLCVPLLLFSSVPGFFLLVFDVPWMLRLRPGGFERVGTTKLTHGQVCVYQATAARSRTT